MPMRVQRVAKTLGFVAVWIAVLVARPEAMASPPLFVYPEPYRFADGRALTSPQTMDVDQITTRIPEVSALTGVVLVVYWSTICPTAACDFSLIDKTIDYWHARGKHVVLTVS
jgi:hypothetical protein